MQIFNQNNYWKKLRAKKKTGDKQTAIIIEISNANKNFFIFTP